MQNPHVGPFALLRRVSADAGEELWQAERVGSDRAPRVVAIRRAADPGDRAIATRVTREYAVLRELDDPHIPAALGHFAGEAALAVGWAPGPTLAQAASAHRRGRLTLDAATVVDLCTELAQALRHAHGRADPQGGPIMHGRLEAHRIRVAPDGSLRLLGLGRSGPPAAPGTLSPERLAGAPPSVLADQWSLGALLVELLGGVPLYTGGPPDQVGAAARREGHVDPWLAPISRVNPAAGRLLERLLAPSPRARFADEGELVRSLQALGRTLPGASDRQGLVERLQDLARIDAPTPVAEPPADGPLAAEPSVAGPLAAEPSVAIPRLMRLSGPTEDPARDEDPQDARTVPRVGPLTLLAPLGPGLWDPEDADPEDADPEEGAPRAADAEGAEREGPGAALSDSEGMGPDDLTQIDVGGPYGGGPYGGDDGEEDERPARPRMQPTELLAIGAVVVLALALLIGLALRT